FFAPKYVKAKQLADEGAFGRVHLVKQGEKHSGPHSDWFWDVEQSGGGAVMDLGCHGIAFCWWFLGKPKVKSVYSQMATQVHQARTQGDDEAVTIIDFENSAVGTVESSWHRAGGTARRRRSPTARPGVWCRRCCTPRTRPPGSAARSPCRSAPKASRSRSISGRRPPWPGPCPDFRAPAPTS